MANYFAMRKQKKEMEKEVRKVKAYGGHFLLALSTVTPKVPMR